MSTSDPRYFQLALLWLRDREKFARYASLVAPIVSPYGAGLACQFLPTSLYGEGMERPDVVNLVYYESQAAYHAFTRDPAFKQIVHLRSESIAMASVATRPWRRWARSGASVCACPTWCCRP